MPEPESSQPPKYLGDPNPAVKVTILFEQGNGLVWKLEKPWDQIALFMEIGLLAAKYELGIEFEFPVGDGMDLVPEEDDEFGGAIWPPAAAGDSGG